MFCRRSGRVRRDDRDGQLGQLRWADVDCRIQIVVEVVQFLDIAVPVRHRLDDVVPLGGESGCQNDDICGSTDGERWTTVDATDTSRVQISLKAECQWEGQGKKAYYGNILVPGFVLVGQKEPPNFDIPFAGFPSKVTVPTPDMSTSILFRLLPLVPITRVREATDTAIGRFLV